MRLRADEVLPLALQVHDKRSDLKVKAVLISDLGLPIKTVAMFHSQDGLYLNNTEKMPLSNFITAQYVVDDPEYTTDSETFYLEPTEPEKEIFLVGEVIKREPIDMILGEVVNAEKTI